MTGPEPTPDTTGPDTPDNEQPRADLRTAAANNARLLRTLRTPTPDEKEPDQ